MLESKHLREQPEAIAEILKARGFQFDVAAFQTLEEKRKTLQVEVQALQNERNWRSKAIGQAKAKKEPVESLCDAVSQLNEKLALTQSALDLVLEDLEHIALNMPNIPHSSVPFGRSLEDNVEVRRVGTVPTFTFTPKSHDELGAQSGLMDFALSAKLTGARFVVMKGMLAKLHRALIRFMLDLHTEEHGYQELYVPYLVNKESLLGTGQLPKFEADLFKLSGEHAYYLIPTSEVPVTNIIRDEMLQDLQLPLKYVCHTPCFRSESGSYGKDTKGMIRQHQFEKVELVWVTHPDHSYEALEQLTKDAETILQRLQLPYRVVALCSADLGFSAAKTYDLEVWLPAQNAYREISSCSNCEAFQARRMKARFRCSKTRETLPVHTLNGSGLAVGRTLVALLENYQTEDGSVRIPEALIPYMGGIEWIPGQCV